VNGDWGVPFQASATSVTSAFHTSVPGDTIIVGVAFSGVLSSVIDSLGNSYRLAAAFGPNAGGKSLAVAYLTNVSGTSRSITATQDISANITIGAFHVGGLALNNPLDTTRGAIGTGTLQDSNTAAPTRFPNEIVIGVGSNNTASDFTWTAGSGYTLVAGASIAHGSSGLTLAMEYKIVTLVGSYNATTTSSVSSNWTQALVSFADTDIGAQRIYGNCSYILP
jgi:hypothetical protein